MEADPCVGEPARIVSDHVESDKDESTHPLEALLNDAVDVGSSSERVLKHERTKTHKREPIVEPQHMTQR